MYYYGSSRQPAENTSAMSMIVWLGACAVRAGAQALWLRFWLRGHELFFIQLKSSSGASWGNPLSPRLSTKRGLPPLLIPVHATNTYNIMIRNCVLQKLATQEQVPWVTIRAVSAFIH